VRQGEVVYMLVLSNGLVEVLRLDRSWVRTSGALGTRRRSWDGEKLVGGSVGGSEGGAFAGAIELKWY
jgi:hypothetical protein